MLNSLFQKHVRENPELPAIVHEGHRISYGEVEQRISAAARALSASGITTGTRVATCYGNDPDNLILLFALARVGAVLATLDPTSTAFELTRIFEDFQPEWLIVDETARGAAAEAVKQANVPTRIVSQDSKPLGLAELLSAPRVLPSRERLVETGRFLVQYTSGSTGKPKGVVQSQRGLAARLRNWNSTASLRPGWTHVCILPLSHGYGNYCVSLPALTSGGTLHLMNLRRRLNPRSILRHIHDQRIDCFYALPFFYAAMIEAARDLSVDLTCLRLAMVGSAPVAVDAVQAFWDRFGVKLNNTYGTSEMGIITSCLREDAPLGAIGKLIQGIEAQPLRGGEGELVVRGDALAEGYFSETDGPPLSRDGWHHTGDLVQVDDRGYYTIAGRISQFINVAGNKVMPAEIEEVLRTVAGVKEVAVKGVDDERAGQVVAAFIVRGGELAESTLREACKSRLAGFKVPQHIRFVDELPKTSFGKVLSSKLQLDG